MSPFISSVRVVRKKDEAHSGLVSICVLGGLLVAYVVFNYWANTQIKIKQEERKALSEQVESLNKV